MVFRILALLFAALLFAVLPLAAQARRSYDVDYTIGFLPATKQAQVTIAVAPGDGRVTRLDFAMDPTRYTDVRGDGKVERADGRTIWVPPAKGGALHYRYAVDSKRTGRAYDARITSDWVIVRGDDLVPSARVRATAGADARARLRFELPPGWSTADTPYLLNPERDAFIVDNPERRFDRPLGWIIAGDLGVRGEWLDDTRVTIAGPKGDDVRRNDMLAFINLTVPEMRHAFGALPSKILIVGADDPMWRGGLSGPRSLFLHADRPTISENGTSTLIHELVHVVTRLRGAKGDDWIAEGLAEYYSVELMHRAGLLSDTRNARVLEWMRNHGKGVKRLHSDRSRGPRTARAVTVFAALDDEIRRESDGKHDLDDVVQALIGEGRVSLEELRDVSKRLIGAPSKSLAGPLFD